MAKEINDKHHAINFTYGLANVELGRQVYTSCFKGIHVMGTNSFKGNMFMSGGENAYSIKSDKV